MFLELTKLSVQYSGRAQPAVKDVSFGLRAGDIGVLIGPSGCGKTTLLRAVAGLEPVTSGTIKLSGNVVSAAGQLVAPEARRIGMVFQDYALFPHMTVEQNVGYGMWIARVPRIEIKDRVAAALQMVDLSEKAIARPSELSGGQKQRVALARAIVRKPFCGPSNSIS